MQPNPEALPRGAGQLRDEILQMLQEVRTLKLDTDLTSWAAPASLMLPFSTTELMLHGSSFTAAGFAAAVHEPDISRRLLRVLAAQLTALSETLSAPMMKPYNPVLGEVIAARGGEPAAAGTGRSSAWRAVAEQVMHHPPVTAFHVAGQSGGGFFRHYGSSGAVPVFRGNSVEVKMVVKPGNTILTLEDGSEEVYQVKSLPSFCLRNVLGIGRSFCEWVGELQIECTASGLVGRIVFEPAKMFGAGGAHRVHGSVTVGSGKDVPVLFQIAGSWTGRVVATATNGRDEVEVLPALAGGQERSTGMTQLPQPLPYDLPPHSLSWERHPHKVWSELTAALKAQNWAGARAAKRKVEDEQRAQRTAMQEAGTAWEPTFFEAGDGAETWVLREGALDRACDPDSESP